MEYKPEEVKKEELGLALTITADAVMVKAKKAMKEVNYFIGI
ncbi:MAG: hypothetical protein PHY16_15020 [Methylobacter sp.]|nr:hypothetical protein [Methylobacter sp.]